MTPQTINAYFTNLAAVQSAWVRTQNELIRSDNAQLTEIVNQNTQDSSFQDLLIAASNIFQLGESALRRIDSLKKISDEISINQAVEQLNACQRAVVPIVELVKKKVIEINGSISNAETNLPILFAALLKDINDEKTLGLQAGLQLKIQKNLSEIMKTITDLRSQNISLHK